MIKKFAYIFLLFPIVAYAGESYRVTILCPSGSGMAGDRVYYVNAKSDLDATKQANKILIEQSVYKNKGCSVKEITKD
jgi:uncharacterized protein YcbX